MEAERESAREGRELTQHGRSEGDVDNMFLRLYRILHRPMTIWKKEKELITNRNENRPKKNDKYEPAVEIKRMRVRNW
jgi:hypothetical protein